MIFLSTSICLYCIYYAENPRVFDLKDFKLKIVYIMMWLLLNCGYITPTNYQNLVKIIPQKNKGNVPLPAQKCLGSSNPYAVEL